MGYRLVLFSRDGIEPPSTALWIHGDSNSNLPGAGRPCSHCHYGPLVVIGTKRRSPCAGGVPPCRSGISDLNRGSLRPKRSALPGYANARKFGWLPGNDPGPPGSQPGVQTITSTTTMLFRYQDSNLDRRLQRPPSCHWTIPDHSVPWTGVEPIFLESESSFLPVGRPRIKRCPETRAPLRCCQLPIRSARSASSRGSYPPCRGRLVAAMPASPCL